MKLRPHAAIAFFLGVALLSYAQPLSGPLRVLDRRSGFGLPGPTALHMRPPQVRPNRVLLHGPWGSQSCGQQWLHSPQLLSQSWDEKQG